ncbi:MAG: S46 family peptidase [Candidatus Marinimicrobia bacterium]|nr:S46 family peptidase [Candidatus Neomarinimicrobiota bacterium]
MKYFKLFMILTILLGSFLFADEGMWTFDNPPMKQLQKKYDFEPSQNWLDHIRLSSVRFMDGGSGSFISPDGLVLTNHHVAVGQLQKMSGEDRNYVKTGFKAENLEDEIKCKDLEVNVLVDFENVTNEVISVVESDKSVAENYKAKKAKMAEIENRNKEKTGMECEVVSLYHGGEYWLYQYKKYTDVRLVFAPERSVAFFGGYNDNFTYPRYDLDFAMFRVYENGNLINSKNYLKWNPDGVKKNELVFVSGHPGSTDRLYTFSQLEFQRDYIYPYVLDFIDRKLALLKKYAKRGPEQQRKAMIYQFGLKNGLKAMQGEYKGLQDTAITNLKKRQEEKLKELVNNDSKMKKKYGDAWENISKVIELEKEKYDEMFYRKISFSNLSNYALRIVRFVEEIEKSDKERLEGYHKADIERLKFRLFSPAPIYKDLEEVNMVDLFQTVKKKLGEDDEFVKNLIGGRNPEEYAQKLFSETKLDQVDFRKKLIVGGKETVEKCNDPLILLAKRIDPIMRKDRKWRKEKISSKLNFASEKIAKARFGIYGKDAYPDATFSLRLSYGTVKGYEMNGTYAPCFTTLYGLYDRAISFKGEEGYFLPERFWQKKDELNLSTPSNFVSTCDIIGGNSGSPVVNKSGEIIGLIFDGNIESLTGRFVYDIKRSRAVSVHIGYITEALDKLYDADFLLDEIGVGKK